jgi:hypothetical protein
MIVKPDFVDHWKTRLLIDLTKDKSAPLHLLRLWSYCETSKGAFFTDMTPARLASICHWGDLKPACHIALLKSGFIEKLLPKGFVVHQWHEYNAKLFANWENGKKHLGKRIKENPNETVEISEPMGSRGLTQPEPIEQNVLIDQRDKSEGTGTEGTLGSKKPVHLFKDEQQPASNNNIPPRSRVVAVMAMTLDESHAKKCADTWIRKEEQQGWLDDRFEPIRNWPSLATSYAEGWLKQLEREKT